MRWLFVPLVLDGCCFFDPATPHTSSDDTGATTPDPVLEADCDGVDDDLNGIVDDGAPAGWLTDPDRWERVATIGAGANGSAGLDLIDAGDGVYVAAAEWGEDYWNDAYVVYHLAEDGTIAQSGRYPTGAPTYVLHAAADDDGRIWFGGESTASDFGVESDPLVVRFDPSDGSWDEVVTSDPGSVAIEVGNVVPDGDGAWFVYSSIAADGSDVWVTGWIDASDGFTPVDGWTLTGEPSAFDGPWLSALDPDGVLWSVGSAEGDADLTHGIIRAGLGDEDVVMVDTLLHPEGDGYEGYTDLAFDGAGRWFAVHNSIDPVTGARVDWRLIQGEPGLPGTWSLWDEVVTAGAWTVAVHPSGTIFAGGEVSDGGQQQSFVRAGTSASGFVTVLNGSPDPGRVSWIWDVLVDGDGVVWALEGDGTPDFTAPSEVHVLRLSCR